MIEEKKIDRDDLVIVDDIAFEKVDMNFFTGKLVMLEKFEREPNKILQLDYKNGKKHGLEIIRTPSGHFEQESTYFEGKLHGYKKVYQQIYHHIEPIILEITRYKHGKLHGKFVRYFKRSGRIRMQGQFKNGLEDGDFIAYIDSGEGGEIQTSKDESYTKYQEFYLDSPINEEVDICQRLIKC
tara:strand:+ start:86 stop:634 length:549 start_codon:yes stop_codon:yes gene_type:complete